MICETTALGPYFFTLNTLTDTTIPYRSNSKLLSDYEIFQQYVLPMSTYFHAGAHLYLIYIKFLKHGYWPLLRMAEVLHC
jgi:hypothetical protein